MHLNKVLLVMFLNKYIADIFSNDLRILVNFIEESFMHSDAFIVFCPPFLNDVFP